MSVQMVTLRKKRVAVTMMATVGRVFGAPLFAALRLDMTLMTSAANVRGMLRRQVMNPIAARTMAKIAPPFPSLRGFAGQEGVDCRAE